MGGESPKPASTPTGAVFLSYASQDAEAAQRICEALRAAGIEVWFDQSALRGGDVWDQTIRKQIRSCALFIPVISQHTHEREEGYFRLEWKLAVDRSHLMTTHRTFLLPVVIDDTREDDENVPDRFKEIHWTRLPAGETPTVFVERVRRLMSPEPTHGPTTTASPAGAVPSATLAVGATFSRPKRAPLVILAAVILGALAYFADRKFSNRPASAPTPPAAPASVPSAAFAPPPHSIAVLPFLNMSGDKEQEYFSDGLTEEILNSLVRINELQVSARTSSFSFKGEKVDLATIARKLNVGAILEGSVRRSGNTVRVTAQLNNAITGFHLWSQTYDRDLSDVLKLQTDIANAVANALKVSLLGDLAAKIEAGGTRNPAAFDAYLRGSKAYFSGFDEHAIQAAIDGFTEAIRLDPQYALAFADRSLAVGAYGGFFTKLAEIPAMYEKARLDAQQSLKLAPELPLGHLALASYFESAALDFVQASAEYERSLALAPGNVRALRDYGQFAVLMGRTDAGLGAVRRALALDPLNPSSHRALGDALYYARAYKESVTALQDAGALNPKFASFTLGVAYYALGDLQQARAVCEIKREDWLGQWCLALVYEKLGRHADAEAEVARMRAAMGDTEAYQYATIYAQWGSTLKALDWLDTALRNRDGGLEYLKADPLVDPLRKEPRFQAVMREVKFPE